MAKSHFALERPRRISIEIPGYDPKKQAARKAAKEKRRREGNQPAADRAAAAPINRQSPAVRQEPSAVMPARPPASSQPTEDELQREWEELQASAATSERSIADLDSLLFGDDSQDSAR